jgi:hypothetical protein
MFSAFQADVAAYTATVLSERIGNRLDLDKVRQQQAIFPRLQDQEQIQVWAQEVNDAPRASAGGRMISEWAKKAECRDTVLRGHLSAPLAGIPEMR